MEAAEKGKNILINRPLMRKPREKTAKKGGIGTINYDIEKDGERRKENRMVMTKALRTRGTGGLSPA